MNLKRSLLLGFLICAQGLLGFSYHGPDFFTPKTINDFGKFFDQLYIHSDNLPQSPFYIVNKHDPGEQINPAISEYVENALALDFPEKMYMLLYFFDEENKYIHDLNSINSSNPAKMLLALYDDRLNLKYNAAVGSTSQGPISITSMPKNLTLFVKQGCEVKTLHSSIEQDYPHALYAFFADEKEIPIAAKKLFADTNITGFNDTNILDPIVLPGTRFKEILVEQVFSNGMFSEVPISFANLLKINNALVEKKYIKLKSTIRNTVNGKGVDVLVEGYQGSAKIFSQLSSNVVNTGSQNHGKIIPFENNTQTHMSLRYKTNLMDILKDFEEDRSGTEIDIVLPGKVSDGAGGESVEVVSGKRLVSLCVNPVFMNGMYAQIPISDTPVHAESQSNLQKINDALQKNQFINISCSVEVGDGTGMKMKIKGTHGSDVVFTQEESENLINQNTDIAVKEIPFSHNNQNNEQTDIGITYTTNEVVEKKSLEHLGSNLVVALIDKVVGSESQELIGKGERLLFLNVGFAFGSKTSIVSIPDRDCLQKINDGFKSGKNISIKVELDNSDVFWKATIKAFWQDEILCSLSHVTLKTADNNTISTSIPSSGKFIEYKTTNMHVPLMIKTFQHTFTLNNHVSLLPGHIEKLTVALQGLRETRKVTAYDIAEVIQSYARDYNISMQDHDWLHVITLALDCACLSPMELDTKKLLGMIPDESAPTKTLARSYRRRYR